MEVILHRINEIKELVRVDRKYGVEIDIRAWKSDLILNHEPFLKGDRFLDYLDEYCHGTLILNIKEVGVESEVLRLVRERPKIKSYFLLDVEFPYIYRVANVGERSMAIRFSEEESVETLKNYAGRVEWAWIDTMTKMPVNKENWQILKDFRTCLVCPSNWGRDSEITLYQRLLRKSNLSIDAIMTKAAYATMWA